jgi:CDP-4-dehydro-6-deoxyglucose reductase
MSYNIKLQPSNHKFSADKEESILTAALRQGVNLPYGCRSGNCGSCKSIIVEGDISYELDQSLCLTDEEKDKGIALLCQARANSDLVIEAQVIRDNEEIVLKKLPCRINEKQLICHDVVQLNLKLTVKEQFAYKAGQYIDILLPDGRRRSFSLANAPYVNGSLELHIRVVDGGDFTNYVLNELEEKAILRVEGPHGQFYLREDSSRPIIFMAGGTGFAPVKGIIEYSITHNMDRPMYLYWGVRSEEDLYMHKLATMWADDFEHIHYIPVLSSPNANNGSNFRTGYVHDAIVSDFSDLSQFDIYASGPPAMVEAGKEAFEKQQLPLSQYYSDAFDFQEPKQGPLPNKT